MTRAGWLWTGGAVALGATFAISRAVVPRTQAMAASDTAITSKSIAFFERKLAQDSANFMVGGQLVARYLMRFQVAAELEDVRRAEVVARSVIPLVSDTGGAYARLGVVYLTQHKFAVAYEAARRAVAWNPRNQEALGLLFDAAVAIGRYAVAESVLARLTPGRMPYQLRRAHMLTAWGRLDGAYHVMDHACRQLAHAEVRPQAVAWCVTELAKIQLARDGEAAAAVLYGRALKIQPGYRAAVEGLADLAYVRRDWAEAARLFRSIAVDAHPDLYLRLAEVDRALGLPAAANTWERAFLRVARAPHAEALYAHPLALYYAARPMTQDTALAIARRDVARRPAVDSYDVLSWTLFRRGDYAQALAASDRALSWGAPTATMEYHRARILGARGRGAEAAALMSRAVERPSLLEPHVQEEWRAP